MEPDTFDPILMRQARIGRSLRNIYNVVAESPLPEQFDMLLRQLDKISLIERR